MLGSRRRLAATQLSFYQFQCRNPPNVGKRQYGLQTNLANSDKYAWHLVCTVDIGRRFGKRDTELRSESGDRLIVEYTRYEIDKKRRGTFEEDYMKAGKLLEASKHCVAYELAHCTEDPDHYILRIEWDSEEGHLKGFRNSREFASFFASCAPT